MNCSSNAVVFLFFFFFDLKQKNISLMQCLLKKYSMLRSYNGHDFNTDWVTDGNMCHITTEKKERKKTIT